jgi:diadenosine tetraphosphate (Ap4A) HIT family hydrolase
VPEDDLADSAVRRWVRQAEVDTGARPGTTTGDAEEAARLRKQLREVIEELDILARAVGVSASVSRWGCPATIKGRPTGLPECQAARSARLGGRKVDADGGVAASLPVGDGVRRNRPTRLMTPTKTRNSSEVVMVGVSQEVDGEDRGLRPRPSGASTLGGARLSKRRGSGRVPAIDSRGLESHADPDCCFCDMLARAAPVCEGDRSASYNPSKPWSPGHVVVIPRDHISDFWDVPVDVQLDVLSLVSAPRTELDQRFEPDRYNVQISVGTAAGQSDGHAVIHVIPRYAFRADETARWKQRAQRSRQAASRSTPPAQIPPPGPQTTDRAGSIRTSKPSKGLRRLRSKERN